MSEDVFNEGVVTDWKGTEGLTDGQTERHKLLIYVLSDGIWHIGIAQSNTYITENSSYNS